VKKAIENAIEQQPSRSAQNEAANSLFARAGFEVEKRNEA
jgi:hypothetical protein